MDRLTEYRKKQLSNNSEHRETLWTSALSNSIELRRLLKRHMQC